MTYLHIHRNRYYYKRKIPHTHHNIVVSLKTDSLTTAKNLLVIINAKTLTLFQRLKKGEYMDVEKIKAMVDSYAKLAIDEYGNIEELRHKELAITKDGKNYAGYSTEAIEVAQNNITDVLQSGDDTLIKEAAQKILKRSTISQAAYYNLPADERRVLHFEILKAEFNILSYDDIRNKGRLTEALNATIKPSFQTFVDESKPIYNSNNAPTENLLPQKNERHFSKTISEIAEAFFETKSTAKELFRYKREIEIFTKIVGKTYFTDITHDDYTFYLQELQYLPDQNKYKRLYKENDPLEVIRISKRDGLGGIKSQTIANKIINVNAFINYAVSQGYISENHLTSKIKYAKYANSKQTPRVDYRMEQLYNLFYKSNWYTTELEKNFNEFPSRIWIPLLLLFNGFRLNEAAQLYLNQVVKRDGVWMFKIAIENEEQRLKNAESKRTIPIHPKLIELGFLNYYSQQLQTGRKRLFEDLYFTKDKGYGQAFSKVFTNEKFRAQWLEAETIQKIKDGIIMLDVHSFRHTFSSYLKGVTEVDTREALMGHKISDSDYGKLKPKVALENISRCQYDVDFTPLREKLNVLYYPFALSEA